MADAPLESAPALTLRFQRPQLPPADAVETYFRASREARWFSNDGPCVHLLRERLSARIGDGARCLPVANATTGLMLALRALTEGRAPEAREVAVPSFTYVASVSAILWAGLCPVFVDVDPLHWHATPDALATAVSARGPALACLMPCSTFGAPPPVEVRRAWEAVGRDTGLPVVVDSASGFGSVDDVGRPVGLTGDAEVFSFHATKPFAVGEGGIVATSDDRLAHRLGQLARFGLDDQRVVVGAPGLNAKMSEIHAAIALAVDDRYDGILAARRSLAARLVVALEPRGLVFQTESAGSPWQHVPALAPNRRERDAILARARLAGIELRTYHQPLHLMPSLRDRPAANPLHVTAQLAERIVSLPMANDLDDADVSAIVSCVTGDAAESS